MNLSALYLAFTYLQLAHGPNDVYVRKGAVENLAADLKASSPHLDLEVFKRTEIIRDGNTGYYVSQNLRHYLSGGNVDPKERGIIITVTFDTPKTADEEIEDDHHLQHIVYLLRKAGVEQSLVSEDETHITSMVDQYYNSKGKRNV